MSSRLEMDVQFLKGIGPKLAVGLNKAGLRTVEDVLRYFPRRYEDRRNLPKIATLRPGVYATVMGRVSAVDARPTRGGQVILQAIVRDETGSIVLTWFNQPWIRRQLEAHDGAIVAYGMVRDGTYHLEMASPEWEAVDDEDDAEEFARIVPVYPLTEGLQQRTIRRAVQSAMMFLDDIEEPLPIELLKQERMKALRVALKQIHWPDTEEKRLEARRRLVFEEFFYLQAGLALKRQQTVQEAGIAFPIQALLRGEDVAESAGPGLFGADDVIDRTPLWDQIHRMLPFDLTGAQRRVIQEIWADMERPHPMNRLVQGDVGSGKTAVAACAMLAAVRSGYQAALMAPTEILAEQHARNLRNLFAPIGIEVELLVGKLTGRGKKATRAKAAEGSAHVLVGTHALIQESVAFNRLGLVVIDEQHRFGVLQRKALRDKAEVSPDVLVMTATPIPRTLVMITYGDLDYSVIDELPPGRIPIKTSWRPPNEREAVYEAVRKFIEEGRQAYFVCPMIGENEKVNAQAATDLHYRLSNGVFEDFRVALLHGQMKAAEKDAVMEAFRKHEVDILVSTTVIEVGVDVPNASVMVIEDANRFGLAQLHQLRGRVGRGRYQSYCVLIADGKSEESRVRMETLRDTTDGFRIAEVDLELRGPGVIAGTAQSGNADFKVADLIQDGKMLEHARQVAIREVEANPGLVGAEWAAVRRKLAERRDDLAIITVS